MSTGIVGDKMKNLVSVLLGCLLWVIVTQEGKTYQPVAVVMERTGLFNQKMIFTLTLADGKTIVVPGTEIKSVTWKEDK